MEEKRPGQSPESEQRPSTHGVHERAAPPPHEAPPTEKERAMIGQARQRAKRDQEAMRTSGHGDHKGVEGF